ncbi:hypothetical protein M8J75_000002 [Diaphorina citri]|nr:hypothetical protein M8J75_000002 [Diaphorina citri]
MVVKTNCVMSTSSNSNDVSSNTTERERPKRPTSMLVSSIGDLSLFSLSGISDLNTPVITLAVSPNELVV